MNMSSAAVFWNNQQVIQEFATADVPLYWETFFAIYRQANQASACRVLDIGCGAGRNTEMLWRYGYLIEACDLHEGMIQATKNRLLRVQSEGLPYPLPNIKLADMCDLPYEDTSFHVVIANGVYHNVSSMQDLEQALSETARILVNNGMLCLNIFTARFIADDIQPSTLPYAYCTHEGLDMVLLPPDKLLSLLHQVGFKTHTSIVEYEREVSTGRRSIMRGIFKLKKGGYK